MTNDSDGTLEPEDKEAELLQAARTALNTFRAHGEQHLWPTTDKHGNPLPRLDVDNPRTTTDDPLLRVGYALLPQLPGDWEVAILHVTVAADEVRTFATVKDRGRPPLEGRLHYPGVSAELAEACVALRRATYEPDGRGVWYNANIRLERNGAIAALYDFVNPPFGCWGPNEVELARRDQELYPRDPQQLPVWHPSCS
ncbi:hypothetical protein EF847_02200 [Actinobacteria bacterium YIM 96077]|uniref:Uncharacterized protein n=1 Tax=Phytoactinopolyspora halophila TaxID=1981511 RepID=A0A329R2X5_9ACTN|nr:hypothetical protein [Phytoactinopolyspora halophila]AYY11715.1 hypothetical protein EF847_02200 [Actinobacteria bacterium YIM 96077]RAW17852.1 hypothetical protein DPM12_03080 [Phytoactinopolyspora halophila]